MPKPKPKAQGGVQGQGRVQARGRSRREAARLVVAAVDATAAYLRDQVGDARAFSLDSPKARAPRLAALRKLA